MEARYGQHLTRRQRTTSLLYGQFTMSNSQGKFALFCTDNVINRKGGGQAMGPGP